jgi:Zn-dependent protease with chaperone function
MSKFFQTGLAAIYVLLTGIAILIMLKLCALPVNTGMALLFMTVWTSFCFSAARFRAGISLFFELNVRKPIHVEEERLDRCLGEVLQRAGIVEQGGGGRVLAGLFGLPERFELLIGEEDGLNAFAIGHHTIVLSRGIIGQMTDDELKGIIAHELGHLMSRDCVARAAFDMAVNLLKIIKWVYGMIRRSMPVRLIIRISRISLAAAIALLLFVAYLFYKEGLLLPVAALVLFVKLFGRLERAFRFLLLQVSRFTEYKQDAYAHHLGYGAALRQALYKLTLEAPQPVNRYFILMKSGHPVIYNRIRRLEELEGLR